MSNLNHSQQTLNINFSSLKLQDSIGSGMAPAKVLQAVIGQRGGLCSSDWLSHSRLP